MGKVLVQISVGFLILEFKNPSENQGFFGRLRAGGLSHPWGTLCPRNIRSRITLLVQWQTHCLPGSLGPQNSFKSEPLGMSSYEVSHSVWPVNEDLPGWKRSLNKCPDKNSVRWTQTALHANPGCNISCVSMTKLLNSAEPQFLYLEWTNSCKPTSLGWEDSMELMYKSPQHNA